MKIVELWRYPVKSMLGEPLEEAQIGANGVSGDRRRAVVDTATGVSLSAKRYGQLLTCRARTVDGEVVIDFCDGSQYAAGSEQASQALSELLKRNVMVQTLQEGQTVRHEFPGDPPSGEGDPFIWEPGLKAFFDRAPLHLMTTATLRAFARAQPGIQFDQARFRPNFLVETVEEGFVEDGWVGGTVSLGPVSCLVLDRKPRCVMITRRQGQLPKDINVMKTVVKANQGNGGIELRALDSGTITIGDPVTFEV